MTLSAYGECVTEPVMEENFAFRKGFTKNRFELLQHKNRARVANSV
jgi:hypothetical protein